jgi:hypothetical protein
MQILCGSGSETLKQYGIFRCWWSGFDFTKCPDPDLDKILFKLVAGKFFCWNMFDSRNSVIYEFLYSVLRRPDSTGNFDPPFMPLIFKKAMLSRSFYGVPVTAAWLPGNPPTKVIRTMMLFINFFVLIKINDQKQFPRNLNFLSDRAARMINGKKKRDQRRFRQCLR